MRLRRICSKSAYFEKRASEIFDGGFLVVPDACEELYIYIAWRNHLHNILCFCDYNHLLYVCKYIYVSIYYIDTDEIPGFLLLLKNHIFTARSEDTMFIFSRVRILVWPWLPT